MIPYATSGQLKALDEKVDSVDERISREKIGYDYKVTYIELFKKMLSRQLEVGKRYRITDYNLALADDLAEDHKSADHPFDIIVTAELKDKISEFATAAECNDYDPYWHYREGDEGQYVQINHSDLSKWSLRYRMFIVEYSELYEYQNPLSITVQYEDEEGELQESIAPFYSLYDEDYTEEGQGWERTLEFDDDENSKYWIMNIAEPKVGDIVLDLDDNTQSGTIIAVTWNENAKGGIVGMTDEHDLYCRYDFKNMLVKGSTVIPSSTARANNWYFTFPASNNQPDTDGSVINSYEYIHNVHNEGYDIALSGYSVDSSIGSGTDKVYIHGIINSKIGKSGTKIVAAGLSNSVIGDGMDTFVDSTNHLPEYAHLNIGNRCSNIHINCSTTGVDHIVTIGSNCSNITLNKVKGPIDIGDDCSNITLVANTNNSTGHVNVTFGNKCKNISLGAADSTSRAEDVTFGKECTDITLTAYAQECYFGNECNHITFGAQMNYCSFGDRCAYITFPKSDSRGTNVQSLTFANNCQCIKSSYIAPASLCQNTWITNILFEPYTGFGWAIATPIDINDGDNGWLAARSKSEQSGILFFHTDSEQNAIMYRDNKFNKTGKYKAKNSTGDWTNI